MSLKSPPASPLVKSSQILNYTLRDKIASLSSVHYISFSQDTGGNSLHLAHTRGCLCALPLLWLCDRLSARDDARYSSVDLTRVLGRLLVYIKYLSVRPFTDAGLRPLLLLLLARLLCLLPRYRTNKYTCLPSALTPPLVVSCRQGLFNLFIFPCFLSI